MDDFRDLGDIEFEIARRGYDREQVDAYIAELRAEISQLQSATAALEHADDGSYPEPVQAELDRVSVEVEAIIGAAREAAEGLRTRAAAEASRWRDEADADARRWRSEAEEESERLRAEAGAAAERTLEEARTESAKQRSDADAYATRIREEADAYAQQTRQAAESAAAQVKEEADVYAASTRSSADEETAEAREQADAYVARVAANADSYAAETRAAADEDASRTREEARADATQWRAEAESESDRLRSEADDYATETRRVATEDAERMTAEADAAAAETRSAAQDYSNALRESADSETARQRSEAREAAETARSSVWEQSTAILENVAREVAVVRGSAETEALAIIADAERQSHRMVSQARQSSEEQRRSARMEAERLVGDAQAQHDEIIETAKRAAAAAQERAQALERRREELMGQLEKAQDAMRTLEEELETKRGTLRDRDVPADTSTVKIVSAPEAEELAGVRVIPSAGRVPPAPVSAEELVDEVRSLREQREQDAESVPVEDGDEPEPEAAKPPAGDLDSLFATLREVEPPDEPTASPSRRQPVSDVDPDELRERLLLPLQNRAHRDVKRQLTEQQNVALEQLRLSGDAWEPVGAEHEAAFVDPITELVVESARAGYLAARELGIRSDGPPELSGADLEVPGADFAADLVAAVGDALESSRSAGESSRKTAGAVSRVYRAWRTDRAELRLREMSDVAYADALRVALRAEGVEDTEWALGEWGSARHAS